MKLRIALAQINTIVGDIQGNTQKILDTMEKAKTFEPDLIAFPEQAVAGYPAEDLLLKPGFLYHQVEAMETIARATGDVAVVVGFAEVADDVYNSAAVCLGGYVQAIYRKMHLPNYAVFDEVRYFQAGVDPMVIELDGRKIGLSICEDIWLPGAPETDEVYIGDAQCILNISASPFFKGKYADRKRMYATRASDLNAYVASVNLVGGQDELVFDGNSVVFNHRGELIAHAKPFEEDLLICDLDLDEVVRDRLHDTRARKEKFLAKQSDAMIDVVDLDMSVSKKNVNMQSRIEPEPEEISEVYSALKLGLRDYIGKNGFKKVIVGLSGGIDSAITAAMAVDALGKENVDTLFMPSKFSSDDSREDALKLASNLGIKCHTVPINDVFEAYLKTLAPFFKDVEPNVAEENIQARIRGNLLYAFSNKFGHMVLTTGNKSENSVGYATLYGDMAGGFNIIKDCSKMLVYRLSEYYNELHGREVIPKRIITKAPTAELRHGQLDTDSLPPYPDLDPILQLYVEQDYGYSQIVEKGFNEEYTAKVIRLVDMNEYKRRMASPGIKITSRAFGKDRRLPITNRYRDGRPKPDES